MIETTEYASMMRRLLASWERRLHDADEPDLAELAEFAHEVNTALQGAVAAWRDSERSWAEIGSALGITRQAAQQRFSRQGGVDA